MCSVADHDIDEPSERLKYCEIHEREYEFICFGCYDDAADREHDERRDGQYD